MTPLRRAAALTAPVVLAFSLTACGGGGGGSAADAPTDASQDDFCGVFDDFEGEAEDIDDDDTDAQADFLGDVSDEFKDVGTPEDISEEQRAGFEVVIDAWSDLDGSDLEGDGADQLGITGDDQESATSFLAYAGQTCGLDD